MSIYSKLAAIQGELLVPKGQRNDFGKYNYRSCEDILKALKPLSDKNRCMVFITNDLEHVGEFNYVKATVTFVDLETGEHIESTAHAREEATKKGMDGSQITGASSSYARKYALAGLFCIDNEKDSDATNKGDAPATVGIAKINTLRKRVSDAGVDEKWLAGIYKVGSLEEFSENQFKNCMDHWSEVMDRWNSRDK